MIKTDKIGPHGFHIYICPVCDIETEDRVKCLKCSYLSCWQCFWKHHKTGKCHELDSKTRINRQG